MDGEDGVPSVSGFASSLLDPCCVTNPPRKQFSVAHLLGLTTLAAAVFWLVQTMGLSLTLLRLGFVGKLVVGSMRESKVLSRACLLGV